MIVFKMWITTRNKDSYTRVEEKWHGYYLFGFIPLYIKCVNYKEY